MSLLDNFDLLSGSLLLWEFVVVCPAVSWFCRFCKWACALVQVLALFFAPCVRKPPITSLQLQFSHRDGHFFVGSFIEENRGEEQTSDLSASGQPLASTNTTLQRHALQARV